MSGAAADGKKIEIERKFTHIRLLVFGERVQKTFLSTPDWDMTFVQNLPPIIFLNKTHPIQCKDCYDVIGIIIPTWSRIASNRRFRW